MIGSQVGNAPAQIVVLRSPGRSASGGSRRRSLVLPAAGRQPHLWSCNASPDHQIGLDVQVPDHGRTEPYRVMVVSVLVNPEASFPLSAMFLILGV